MSEEKPATPSVNWGHRTKRIPLPREQAARQGDITSFAFLSLGKEAAIAFLNTEDAELGGRPLSVAIQSKDGATRVRAKVQQLMDVARQ